MSNSPSVLVVDDNPDVGRLIVVILNKAHISAVTVMSGADALAWLTKSWASLVILDFNMPAMNGAEFLNLVHADPALATIPIVLHTALDRDTAMAQVQDRGVVGFLRKGRYLPSDVVAMVQEFASVN